MAAHIGNPTLNKTPNPAPVAHLADQIGQKTMMDWVSVRQLTHAFRPTLLQLQIVKV
jgi:hypothetical protein